MCKVCVPVNENIYTHTCVYVCVCVFNVCVYACMHVYTHTQTHTNTHTHKHMQIPLLGDEELNVAMQRYYEDHPSAFQWSLWQQVWCVCAKEKDKCGRGALGH